MQQAQASRQFAREDLFFGQVATIVARWFLIAAGVILVLWSATNISEIPIPIALMVVLTAMNFYLHGRYLVERPVKALIVYATSGIDLLIVTAMMAAWTAWGVGIHNPFFVLLYPTILAFGLVFPPRITVVYSTLTIAAYFLVVLAQTGTGVLLDVGAQRELFQRVVTLAGTAGLATFFWRTQRRHRQEPQKNRDLPEGMSSSGLVAAPGH
jgi:hypothetical protein